jgi:GAF domain
VPRHVVLLTRDASLVVAVKALLDGEDRVSEVQSPQDLPPAGELPVDAVVVDLPQAAREASVERVRGRFSGPLVVLLGHGEDPDRARADYRCSVLTRPFGMAQLWSLLVDSASEALTEVIPAIPREFEGEVPPATPSPPPPRERPVPTPPPARPSAAPPPRERPAPVPPAAAPSPPPPRERQAPAPPPRERPPSAPAPAAGQPWRERRTPAPPSAPPLRERPASAPPPGAVQPPRERPAPPPPSAPPPPRERPAPPPGAAPRPAAGPAPGRPAPVPERPTRVADQPELAPKWQPRPAAETERPPTAPPERPAAPPAGPPAPPPQRQVPSAPPAAAQRSGPAEAGERATPTPSRPDRAARPEAAEAGPERGHGGGRVAAWSWRLRRSQHHEPEPADPDELTQPMPPVPPPRDGNGVAARVERPERPSQPAAAQPAQQRPPAGTPPAPTPTPSPPRAVPDPPEAVARRLAERLGADTVALLLDNNRGLLEVAGAVGLTPAERQLQVEYGHDVLLELFRVGAGLIEDTERVRPLIRGIPGSRSQSLVMVPLVHEGHGFGALIIGRTSPPGQPRPEFTEPEIEALMDFAEDVAAPLRSTVLLRRLKGHLSARENG